MAHGAVVDAPHVTRIATIKDVRRTMTLPANEKLRKFCGTHEWALSKGVFSRLKRTSAGHLSLEEAMQESPGHKPWDDTTRPE
jgi:hypothetical protein